MTDEKKEYIESILRNIASAILLNQVDAVQSYVRDLRLNIGLEKYPEYLTSLDVQDEVCKKFNVTIDDLLIKTRKQEYAIPRLTLMYIWRVFFKMKVNTIAKKLKLRDHCMVLYAKRKVPEWLKYDCEFAEKVSPILDKCKECKCRVTEKPDRIS